MKFETLEEKELWKAVLIAGMQSSQCSYEEAVCSADLAIEDFRKRIYDQVDTGI